MFPPLIDKHYPKRHKHKSVIKCSISFPPPPPPPTHAPATLSPVEGMSYRNYPFLSPAAERHGRKWLDEQRLFILLTSTWINLNYIRCTSSPVQEMNFHENGTFVRTASDWMQFPATRIQTSYGRWVSLVARRRIRVDYCQNLALVSWSSHSRIISNDSDRLSMCVTSSSSLNISIKARTADRRVAWRRTCQVWTPGQWARRRWDGKMCSDTALEMCLVCCSAGWTGEIRGSRMRGNRRLSLSCCLSESTRELNTHEWKLKGIQRKKTKKEKTGMKKKD